MDYEMKVLTESISVEGGEPCQLTEEIPVFTGGKCAKRLNWYYSAAHSALVDSLSKSSRPLPTEITVTATVTENRGETLSLYRDFRWGNKTVRHADNWRNGFPLTLKQLGISRRDALAQCAEQCRTLAGSGYVCVYEDYARRIRNGYKKDDFYIKDSQAVIFCQPGVIAPERTGILIFPISLSQTWTPNG